MHSNDDVHICDEKLNLEERTCPNREQRANGINVYYGPVTQLIKDAKSGNLKMSERKFQQSAGCALNFYLAIRISTIRDAVLIFHAPVGCSASDSWVSGNYSGIYPQQMAGLSLTSTG